MAFIAGKGFAILNSKAEKGDQKAKDLLAKLDKIDQEEADRLFSEILGKGGGGKGKSTEKKIKAPGASATDGQGKITEGAEEQPPSGKATPKKAGEEPVDAPKEPTGEVKPKSKRELREMVDGVTKKLSDLESSGRKITDKGLEKLAQKYGTDVDSIMDIAVQNDIDLESIYRETRTPTGKVTPKETITTVTKPVQNKTPLEKPVGQVEEKYGNQVPRGFTLQFDEDENREYLSNDETGDQYQIEVTADGKVSIPELGISASSIDKLTQGFNQPGEFLKEAAPGFGAAQERREKQGQAPADIQDQGRTQLNNLLNSSGGDVTRDELKNISKKYNLPIEEVQNIADEWAIDQDNIFEENKRLGKTLPFTSDTFIPDFDKAIEQSKITPITDADVERLAKRTGGTKDDVTKALEKRGANFANQPGQGQAEPKTKQEYAKKLIDDITEPGDVSIVSIEANDDGNISGTFPNGNSFDMVVEPNGTHEIAIFDKNNKWIDNFKTRDLDEIRNIFELSGEKDEVRSSGQEQANEPIERIGDLAPWEEENIKNILQKTGGDKAKTLEVLKQQQAAYEGPTLKEKYLTGIIDQAAAGETNITLPAPAEEPTAEQLAEVEPLVAEGDQRQQARAAIDDLMEDGMGKLQPEEVGELAARYGLTVNDILDIEQESLSEQDRDTGDRMSLFGENPSDPTGEGVKQQARRRIDDIMQEGRGQVSQEEAEALSEEFGLTVDEVRQLERQSQSETPFPDVQGTPLADTPQERADFILQDNQGVISNQEIQEIADEFGISFEEAQQTVRTQLANQEYKMADDPNEEGATRTITGAQQLAGQGVEVPQVSDNTVGEQAKISLTTKEGTPQSLSNIAFSLSLREGYVAAENKVKEIIAKAPSTAKGVADALNKSNVGFNNWVPVSEDEKSIVIQQTDRLGNTNNLRINKPIVENEQIAKRLVERISSTQQPQQAAAKPDRQKVEKAAADLGVDANLLEGLLELLKKVR